MMGIFHMSLFSESGLLKQERTSYSALRQAFKRTGLRPRVSRKERRLVKTKSKKYLGSVNFKARTRWSKAFCSEFSRFFHLNKDRRYPDQPLFLVTLTDIFCTTEHKWPAPGSEDTELGVLMELEVRHGEAEVYP
jgi:hypothetical protein